MISVIVSATNGIVVSYNYRASQPSEDNRKSRCDRCGSMTTMIARKDQVWQIFCYAKKKSCSTLMNKSHTSVRSDVKTCEKSIGCRPSLTTDSLTCSSMMKSRPPMILLQSKCKCLPFTGWLIPSSSSCREHTWSSMDKCCMGLTSEWQLSGSTWSKYSTTYLIETRLSWWSTVSTKQVMHWMPEAILWGKKGALRAASSAWNWDKSNGEIISLCKSSVHKLQSMPRQISRQDK